MSSHLEVAPDVLAPVLHTTSFRLAYADCDPAGIVYYATYYGWMERTHTEWWFLRGVWLEDLSAQCGVQIVTKMAHADFNRPLRLLDLVSCSMYCDRIGDTSFTQGFQFRTEADVVAANATLCLVCLDVGGRPVRVPDRMRELLTAGD
jgi:acyl-CoA thioester hydrolase